MGIKTKSLFAVLVAIAALAGTPSAAADAEAPAANAPEDIYLDLRNLALGMAPADIGLESTGADEPYGIVMDIDFDGPTATVVSFVTGDASIYFSTGGGMIGSGNASEDVASAARQFVLASKPFLSAMVKSPAHPRPDQGEVTFYVITPGGTYAATREQKALGEQEDAFSPLFYAGQDVLTEIRLLQERQQPDGD